MQPIQIRETFRSVDPNRMYSIVLLLYKIDYARVERGVSLMVAARASAAHDLVDDACSVAAVLLRLGFVDR
jgi:hypothetical protein